MKVSTLLIIEMLLCIFTAEAQDTLLWKQNQKLEWTDFKAKADTTIYGTWGVSNFDYTANISPTGFTYRVRSYFVRSQSWIKMEYGNRTLDHERGHFNINEVFARRLRKAFDAYQFNAATAESDLRKIYENLIKERDKMNAVYEIDTNYSRKTMPQIRWNNEIKAELKKLENYQQG